MNNERIGGPSGRQTPRFFGSWALVRVHGTSMEPTLRQGDVVLTRRGGQRTGRLALVYLPGDRPLSVKRLIKRDRDGWWVERDNPREGIDSWVVGAIPEIDVVASVVGRLWPIWRKAPSR